jgi:hypothetical protein
MGIALKNAGVNLQCFAADQRSVEKMYLGLELAQAIERVYREP